MHKSLSSGSMAGLSLIEDPSDGIPHSVSTTATLLSATPPSRHSGRFVHPSLRMHQSPPTMMDGSDTGMGRPFDPAGLEVGEPALPWFFEALVIRATCIRVTITSLLVAGALKDLVTLTDAPIKVQEVVMTNVLLPLPELVDRITAQYMSDTITNFGNVMMLLVSHSKLRLFKNVVASVVTGFGEFLEEAVLRVGQQPSNITRRLYEIRRSCSHISIASSVFNFP